MIIGQRRHPATSACSAILLLLGGIGGCAWLADKEQVTFYHTYGYQKEEGGAWSIPLMARVYEPSRRAAVVAEAVDKLADTVGRIEPEEQKNLDFRLGELLADSEAGENIKIRFDKDTEDFPKPDSKWETNKYGLLVATLELSDLKVQELLKAQKSANSWLDFRATSSEHSGEGRVHIVESTGVSVISDIDDTIKVSEVPAGKETLFANTFLRKFQAIPQRTDLYKGLEDKSFHYVSGSPWQLGKPLVDFLFKIEKFPEGSIHMNDLIQNVRDELKAPSIDDLNALVAGDGIFDQKIRQITEIMTRFPKRTFVLIGDSGECDPEVYRKIKYETDLGNRVTEIRIRDVVDEKHKVCKEDKKRCERLKDMTVIEAATVNGVSKFDKGGCPPQPK